jgi:hypothetical protein
VQHCHHACKQQRRGVGVWRETTLSRDTDLVLDNNWGIHVVHTHHRSRC